MTKIVVNNSRPKSAKMKVMTSAMKSNMKTMPMKMSKLKKV